ncbi:diacylglycerol kinase family protein [Pedobacter rhizosphaerae]|uniref:Undecaprenol kinase n=1 Tax=Pedobacter rhizosphaerae TaxID=390241 RepID=A0A1H9PGB0_9SPHI|nr:diacylglycerol kinase family protein [Pedobacter rhizosphaerae]SER46603.1 undecaprenol kinase [Pedobacter rhizosphaerae]
MDRRDQKFSVTDRLKSFKYAFSGIRLFFVEGHNARIHLLAAVLVIAISFYYNISHLEWMAILFAVALVWVTEMINTALETLSDVVSPVHHPKIKIVKDIAAGAVLIAAVAAVIVALLIFLPRLFPGV